MASTTMKCSSKSYSSKLRSWNRTFHTTCSRRTHYETLGVPESASKSQIKSHFYKLSKKHHPDVSRDPESKAFFRKASEAYAILSNDRDRRAYDRSLLHRPHAHTPQPFHPRAPPNKAARATHAWEYRPRAPRRPPLDYMHNTMPGASSNPTSSSARPQVYSQSPQHDYLTGSRRKAENVQREMDKIRNELPFVRTIQVLSLLGLSFAIFAGFGHRS